MVLALHVLCFKMWLGILIGLGIITKAHGYSSGYFPEVCQSMSPSHSPFSDQEDKLPFEVTYELGKSGEPITVILQSKSTTQFEGFMLEARVTGMVEESPPVGTFILLDPGATRLLTCGDQAGSAVSQRFNHQKSVIKVNWTAPAEELNITFSTTANYCSKYYKANYCNKYYTANYCKCYKANYCNKYYTANYCKCYKANYCNKCYKANYCNKCYKANYCNKYYKANYCSKCYKTNYKAPASRFCADGFRHSSCGTENGTSSHSDDLPYQQLSVSSSHYGVKNTVQFALCCS
ncbi:uncharacterized protein LOC119029156 isoform X2 [Acanthopagrus latus]|uniref:uncharacterized protein LOC119029156 isoform X2 n=1 Tax=Acanthopagrus latus TaxID=8177 RepID=UPI00187CBB4D|nr:uncharacterized protein LOC119029156 isoform X2 [Acanthopagrus latus]